MPGTGGGTAGVPLRVFAVAVLGIAVFSYMDSVMKGLVLAIGTYTTLFWRSLASTVLAGALYASRPQARPSRSTVAIHVVRGTVSAVMAFCFFWGLARIPMAQAVALTFVAPLLSLYLAALLLGERVTRRMVAASSVAFAGVVVILANQWQSTSGPDATLGALAVLVSSLCYAFNIVLMRKQALVAGPLEVAFSQSLVVTILFALGAPFAANVPDATHVPTLLFAAMLAVGSLMLLAWAYARGEANALSTSEYTAFVWAALLGWFRFGEPLSAATVAGAALIVAGCLLATRATPAPLVAPESSP